MIAMVIAVYLIAMGGIAYKRYEEPHRLHAAAQTLLMDLKLQEQKARSLDRRHGIQFDNGSTYRLGFTASDGLFYENQVRRTVMLTREFSGIKVTSIGGASPPQYVYFDPRAAEGTTWAPFNTSFSSYPGQIVLHCSSKDAIINIWRNGEITVEYK
jgi:hypothetical protein